MRTPALAVALVAAVPSLALAQTRTLSDVARELRKRIHGTGNFSAVESTIPQRLIVYSPPAQEVASPAPEPETVVPVEPEPWFYGYAPAYPAYYGGGHRRHAYHPSVPAHRPPVHVSGPRPTPYSKARATVMRPAATSSRMTFGIKRY